jgi:hypothetical protein
LRREATEAKKKESPRTIKILVTVLPNLKWDQIRVENHADMFENPNGNLKESGRLGK